MDFYLNNGYLADKFCETPEETERRAADFAEEDAWRAYLAGGVA